MSPTIRSRGGQPLFVGGMVAGADTCCCENPPPPVCRCPDFCSFNIGVTSPTRLSVSLPNRECTVSPYAGRGVSVIGQLFGSVTPPFGFQPVDLDIGPAYQNVSNAVVVSSALTSFQLEGIYASVSYRQWYYDENYVGGTSGYPFPYMSASVDFEVAVWCDPLLEKWRLRFATRTSVILYSFVGGLYGPLTRNLAIQKDWYADLSSSCYASQQRYCSEPPRNETGRFLSTPLTFTVSADTISLTNNVTSNVTLDSGMSYEPAHQSEWRDFALAIQSAAESATFRITSRPSCRDASCTCNSELYGLQLTLGYFTATIGEYYFYEDTITYRFSSALQNNGWSIVLWQKDSEWRFTKMLRVDMYCNSSSGSPKWYAYIRTRCIEYDNQGVAIYDSTDSWMGTFDCYESCEFAADDSFGLPRSRAKGDPIPLGDVQNVEYLGRESIYPECNPPDLPVVRIGQVEAC